MSIVAYCPYLAAQSFARKMLQDNKPAVDIAIGLFLWAFILVNLSICLRAAQVSDIKRAVAAAEAEVKAANDARVMAEAEVDTLQEVYELQKEREQERAEAAGKRDDYITDLEGVVKGLREENAALKLGVEALKQGVPRKVIGMKILGGDRRAGGPVTAEGARVPRLEDQVQEALGDGWEISGAPMKSGESGLWFQNMLRYEAGKEAPEAGAEEAPSFSYTLNAEEVAEKIRALPKGLWQTSYDIQKALAPVPPHKTPFAPIKLINCVLYAMLGKGEAEKGKHQDFVRPIWKLL